ncbi:hypothetical protein BKA62DRAFT_216268 [Auriculariales sp. MPI-PUGE-AT-0066]|nr:hypothetical protein BKA62DRAFT_216268 [Auriculariales sp. MPI-PUGE-AT-0066]
MPRLPALTLISALLLVLSLNTAPVAANVSPLRLSHRGGEHARMMRRYAQHGAVARGLLDGVDGSTDTNTPGATPTPSASHNGGLGGAIGTAIGGGDHSTTDPAESSPTASATSSTTKASESSSETTTTRTRASTTPPAASTPTPKSSSTSTTATRATRTVYTAGQTLTPEQQQEVDDNREKQSTLSRISPNVRVGLIVAASVLAGLLIIWTAVRRWKLRSSRSFQARLAPIDWQPDSDKDHTGAGGLAPPPPMTEVSDKASIRHNMFAPDGQQQSLAPPPHDFTAVPGGYSRSGSPMPNSYGRTPSPAPFGSIPRTDSPAPVGGLQRYPSNGSGHGSNGYGGYEQHQHGGYDPNVHRGY